MELATPATSIPPPTTMRRCIWKPLRHPPRYPYHPNFVRLVTEHNGRFQLVHLDYIQVCNFKYIPVYFLQLPP